MANTEALAISDLNATLVRKAIEDSAFRAQLVQIIRRFEPRFKSVTVELLNNADPLDRTLRFRIQAVLLADLDGEPVVYDSMLDVASRNFQVATVDDG